MDLSTLRHRAEPLLERLARADHRQRAGLRDEVELASLYARSPELSSPEAWACALEARERAPDDTARARARSLARLVALLREGTLDAGPLQERLAFEASASLRFEGVPIPLRGFEQRIGAELESNRRAELARARDSLLPHRDREESARVERRLEVAGELGFASYPALVAELTGVDLALLAEQARATLRATEDAYRDLLGFGLKRMVGPVGPHPRGEAAEHDLVRFRALAPLEGLFAPQWLLTAARRFLEWIGLPLEGSGRLVLDLEPRAHKAPGGFVTRFAVPGTLGVTLRPSGSAADFSGLFHGLGSAAHLAAIDPGVPFEDRWLGDDAVPEAFGLAFENLLLDGELLARLLEADPHRGAEAARLLAVERLLRLRLQCAQLVWELDLYKEGPVSDLKGLYRELMSRAALCDWPLERWLWEVEPGLPAATRLRAWGLEAALHELLLDRANEDHWRNPRTGSLLARLSERGHGADSGIAAELGAGATLEEAAERLIRVASR